MLVGHERSIAHTVYAREVGLDIPGRMALAVKDDKASNPVAISLLGPDAVVLDSVPVADADLPEHKRTP